MIAKAEGYFIEEGVRVSIKEFKGGKQALVNGVFKGEVEMATTADVPIVFNSFNKQQFKIVATIGSSDNEPRVIARKDRGISKPEDLKGKHVITKRGSAVHYFLNVFLLHSGLTTTDIKLKFTKSGKEMAQLLNKGDIDAFSHREPFISQAKTLLGDNAVIFEKPGIYLKTFNLVASNNVVSNKPEAVKKILRALIRAETFSKENPKQAITHVSTFIGLSEEVLENIWEKINLSVSLEQSLIVSLESEGRWAIKTKLVKAEKIPNYLDYIHISGLKSVKPDAIEIYQ